MLDSLTIGEEGKSLANIAHVEDYRNARHSERLIN